MAVSSTTKQPPRPLPVKRRPARSVPLDVHGWTKPATCGYRCHASGGVGWVPFSGDSSVRTPRLSIVAFLPFKAVRGGPVYSWRGGHQYAPELMSTQVQVPRPAPIETMHCRREDSSI